MRVVLADPPAYTPPYDHSLAAALARAGTDVELVTSRFRFGSVPALDGYATQEWFYPLSSRLGSSRLRLSVKALGLNKLNDVRELPDSPQVRGLINQLHYLVRVEA